jgi:predicted alpha/beta hydrolase
MRASRQRDWGYAALLGTDIPATREVAAREFPGLPMAMGGHSLGGQLACCSLALAPACADELWLVASGAPYFRAFPWAYRLWLPIAYHLLATLARAFGALPGRRIGFGGQEALGVILDWSRTALTGRYGARDVGDMESRLADVCIPVHAVLFERDWLAPRGSLDFLLGKLGPGERSVTSLDAAALGTRADHFQWMRAPDAVARALAG